MIGISLGRLVQSSHRQKLLGLDKGVTDDDATAKPVTIEFVAVDCKRYTDADIDRQADGSFFIKRHKASLPNANP